MVLPSCCCGIHYKSQKILTVSKFTAVGFTAAGFTAAGMTSAWYSWYQLHRDNGIARMIIGRKIFHHLTLKNNNTIHQVIMRNVMINAPNPWYTHGTRRNQWGSSRRCGTSSILQVVFDLGTALNTDLGAPPINSIILPFELWNIIWPFTQTQDRYEIEPGIY